MERLELIAAVSAHDSIEFSVRAGPETLSEGIGSAVASQNFDRYAPDEFRRAFSNGGHIRYEVFYGESGATVECSQTDGTCVVRVLYNPKNKVSRQNALGLVQSLYHRMDYGELPAAIRRAEEQLGYTAQHR